MEAWIRQSVHKEGYAILKHHTGSCAIVQDPTTGKFFEDLTDQDVHFVDVRGVEPLSKAEQAVLVAAAVASARAVAAARK